MSPVELSPRSPLITDEKPIEKASIDWKKVAIITAITLVAIVAVGLIVASAVASCGGSLAVFGVAAAFLGSNVALGVGIGGVTLAALAAIGVHCASRKAAEPADDDSIRHEPMSRESSELLDGPRISETIDRLRTPFTEKLFDLASEDSNPIDLASKDSNPIYRASSPIVMPRIVDGTLTGGFQNQFQSMNYAIQDVELEPGDKVGNFTKVAAKLGLTAEEASGLAATDPRFHAMYVLAGQADVISQDEMSLFIGQRYLPQVKPGQIVEVVSSSEEACTIKVTAEYQVSNFSSSEVVGTFKLEQTVTFARQEDSLPMIRYSRKTV